MSQANEPKATAYSTFNHFFTRSLKPGTRPIDNRTGSVICPVDGSISQIGQIKHGEIFQAKGRHFDLPSLLANDKEMIDAFQDGLFATLYLSPRDYHRIHMPVSGTLNKMIYVPGRLFPVNEASVKIVDRLFARNERIINYFHTNIGPLAVIMVGAINVGSMETVWEGEITPARDREVSPKQYPENSITLNQGEEMGRFNMGSTVILLFGKDTIDWAPEQKAEGQVMMGQLIGIKHGNI